MKYYRCYRGKVRAVPKCMVAVVAIMLCIVMLFPIAFATDVFQTGFVVSVVDEIKAAFHKTYDPYNKALGLYRSEEEYLEYALSCWVQEGGCWAEQGCGRLEEELLDSPDFAFYDYVCGNNICLQIDKLERENGESTGLLFVSCDGGETWENSEKALPSGCLKAANGPYVVYSVWGWGKQSCGDYLLISKDGGKNFENKVFYHGLDVSFREFIERDGKTYAVLNLGTERYVFFDVIINLETLEEEQRIFFDRDISEKCQAFVNRKYDIFPNSDCKYLSEEKSNN